MSINVVWGGMLAFVGLGMLIRGLGVSRTYPTKRTSYLAMAIMGMMMGALVAALPAPPSDNPLFTKRLTIMFGILAGALVLVSGVFEIIFRRK